MRTDRRLIISLVILGTHAAPFGGHLIQRDNSFFRRSESILSLCGYGRDLLETPVSEALPLATQPQLLNPDSGRTELFGSSRYEHFIQLNGFFSGLVISHLIFQVNINVSFILFSAFLLVTFLSIAFSVHIQMINYRSL